MKDEEIIDILNRFHIQEYEWFIDDKEDNSFCSSSEEDSIKIEKAVYTLLERYKKQQKEIEALKLVHETYKEQMESIEDRYISKDKLREKIKKAKCYAWHNRDDEYWANVIIESFEELLEE